uniref:DNA cytosine methyltransferase n=1 Tax=Endozoicomonas sp. Mp262 TaxID=2919499 RepID=UPI00351AF342
MNNTNYICGTYNNAFRDSAVNQSPTLRSGNNGGAIKPAICSGAVVRRLTPVECERLQGFPDGYTAIPWKNKLADQCPDGPRYKALGNSIAVPVLVWIGQRLEAEIRPDNPGI